MSRGCANSENLRFGIGPAAHGWGFFKRRFWGDYVRRLHAFHADTRIYFGETANLTDRVGTSLKEQGFGDTIIYMPLNPQCCPSEEALREMRKDMEALCISALHTLTWGHGTPLSLTNCRHVELLEDVAWCSDRSEDISLALSIARTILRALGMPTAWFGLPCRLTLCTNVPALIARHNEKKLVTLAPRGRASSTENVRQSRRSLRRPTVFFSCDIRHVFRGRGGGENGFGRENVGDDEYPDYILTFAYSALPWAGHVNASPLNFLSTSYLGVARAPT